MKAQIATPISYKCPYMKDCLIEEGYEVFVTHECDTVIKMLYEKPDVILCVTEYGSDETWSPMQIIFHQLKYFAIPQQRLVRVSLTSWRGIPDRPLRIPITRFLLLKAIDGIIFD